MFCVYLCFILFISRLSDYSKASSNAIAPGAVVVEDACWNFSSI